MILCNDGLTIGYTDSISLRNDLSTKEDNIIFTLCPDTMFDLSNEPIHLSRSVIFQCGSAGRLRSNCTFQGGHSQVFIDGDYLSVSFLGLTFQRAEHISVSIEATKSNLSFSSCQWRHHDGDVVVSIGGYHQFFNDSTESFSDNLRVDNVSFASESAIWEESSIILSKLDLVNTTTETLMDPIDVTTHLQSGRLPFPDHEGGHVPSRRRKRTRMNHRHLSSLGTSVSFEGCFFSVSYGFLSCCLLSSAFQPHIICDSRKTYQWNQ